MNTVPIVSRCDRRCVAISLLAALCFLAPTTLVVAAVPPASRYLALEVSVDDGPVQLIAVAFGGRIRYSDSERNLRFVVVSRDDTDIAESDAFALEVREASGSRVGQKGGDLLDSTSGRIGEDLRLSDGASTRIRVRPLRLARTVAEALDVDPVKCQTRGSLVLYEGGCTVGCPSSISIEAAGVRAECGICCNHLDASR
jgi:hypothetical protein